MLQLFYEKFPKFQKVPFHVSGESYAGTYLPNIASVIHQLNQKQPTPSAITIPLESVLIGNGLTDAYTQFASVPEWSCDKGGNPYGPIFDEQTCASIKGKVGTCQRLTQYCYNNPSRFVSLCPFFLSRMLADISSHRLVCLLLSRAGKSRDQSSKVVSTLTISARSATEMERMVLSATSNYSGLRRT